MDNLEETLAKKDWRRRGGADNSHEPNIREKRSMSESNDPVLGHLCEWKGTEDRSSRPEW